MSTFKDRVALEISTVTSRYVGDLQDAINDENYELAAALKHLDAEKDSDRNFIKGRLVKLTPSPKQVEFTSDINLSSERINMPDAFRLFLVREGVYDMFCKNYKSQGSDYNFPPNEKNLYLVSSFLFYSTPEAEKDEVFWHKIHIKWINLQQ